MKESSNVKSEVQKISSERKPAISPNGFQDLFEDQLIDIYRTEKTPTRDTSELIKNSASHDLMQWLKNMKLWIDVSGQEVNL